MTIEKVQIETWGQTHLHLEYKVIRPLEFLKERVDDLTEWNYFVVLEVDKASKEDTVWMGNVPDSYHYSVYMDEFEGIGWEEEGEPTRLDIPDNKVYIGTIENKVCYGDKV